MRSSSFRPRSNVLTIFLLLLSRISAQLLGSVVPSSSPTNKKTYQENQQRDLNSLSVGNGTTLRILCLGASIVYGYKSTDGNGFRYALRGKLIEQGNAVNMIGSVSTGKMFDNQVEAWGGYRIDEVAKKVELSLPSQPNLVLIHVGTNDMTQDHDVANAPDRLGKLVDRIFAVVPTTTIIVSKLLPNGNAAAEASIITFNQALVHTINSRTSAGKKVSLVDMHSDWFSVADLRDDGTHPTDAGYMKMAKVFYTGILAVGDTITPPAAVQGVDDTAAKNDGADAGSAMDVVCDVAPGQTMGLTQKMQCTDPTELRMLHLCFLLGLVAKAKEAS